MQKAGSFLTEEAVSAADVTWFRERILGKIGVENAKKFLKDEYAERLNAKLGVNNVPQKRALFQDLGDSYHDPNGIGKLLDGDGLTDDVVEAWDKVSDLPSLRKDAQYLSAFNKIYKDNRPQKHIFEGEVNAAGTSVSGVHHIDAINGGTARIIPGTEIPGPNGLYKAKIEGKNATGNWVPKSGNNGYSTFFPDNWSKERTMKEIANAYKTRSRVTGLANTFEGTSIDGSIRIQMFLRPDNSIISSFPTF